MCLFLLPGLVRVSAQDFVLTLTNTPDPILLGSNIVYSLSVSNATGHNLNPGTITSEFTRNAEFVGATSQFGYTSLVDHVIFAIPENAFPENGVIAVMLELRGTNAGLLTNVFTVAINDGGQTEPAETNAVSSIEPPQADLGISILGPSDGVFPGDPFSYRLLATNAGPDDAPGVVVSNPFPSNVTLQTFSPTDQVQVADGFVLFSAGTITNQGSASATISMLATNAAPTNLITATIGATSSTDTNTVNNSFTSNIPILAPVLGQIIVTNISAQELNPQTGWMEQKVRLQNVGTTSVDSVRLLVDGLTNRLINATGTNGTIPYAAQGTQLAPGQQVELVLEYFNPTRTAGSDPTLTAYGTPQLDLTPHDGTGLTVDRIVALHTQDLNNGRILLEWPASSGARYQIIYDDQPDFHTAKGSLPPVTVPAMANRAQWLDEGPPRTLTTPTNAAARFYKVIQLP